MQPPQGLVEKVKGLRQAQAAGGLDAEDGPKGACQELVLEPDLDALPIQHCWPGDPAPFITLPAVITRTRVPASRNVGMYRMQKIDARSTYMHWQIHKDGRADWLAAEGSTRGRRGARARPDHRLLGERASPEAHRRVHARRLPAWRRGRDRQVQDDRPRGAGECRDRPRGHDRGRRHGHGGAVRRPHRLLLAAGAVPDLPPERDDDAPRRRSTRRSSSGSRRRRTPGWARRPSASSCRPSA